MAAGKLGAGASLQPISMRGRKSLILIKLDRRLGEVDSADTIVHGGVGAAMMAY